MPHLEFRIRTKAELQGALQTQAALEKQIGTAKALGKDYGDLAAKLDKVNKSIAEATPALKAQEAAQQKAAQAAKAAADLEKKAAEEAAEAQKKKARETERAADASRKASEQAAADQRSSVNNALRRIPGVGGIMDLGASAGSAAVAGIAAVGAAAAAAAKGLSEYAGAQTRVAGLDAALAQTGQLTDDYRERLQALAAQFQETTGVADDEWIGVLTRLTQFGSNAENIERDAEAVKNLAGIMGGDLVAASNLIARANQGSYQSFSRMGIQIDENASQTEKLAKLYEELAQRGGGQLEARSRTLTGQFGQLKNATSDLFEAIGRGIAETGVLQKVLQGLTDAAGYWAEALGGPVKAVDGLTSANRRTKLQADESAAAIANESKVMADMAKQSDIASSALDKVIDQLRKTKSQEDQTDDAQKDLELKKLAERAQVEKLSATQVAAEKFKIEDAYRVKKNTRDLEYIDREIAINKQAIEDRLKVEQAAEERLRQERAKQADVNQRNNVDDQIATQQKRLDDAEAVFRKAAGLRNKLGSGGQDTAGVAELDAQIDSSSAVIRDSAGTLARLRAKRRGFAESDADVSSAEAALKAAREATAAETQKRAPAIGELSRDRVFTERRAGIQRQTEVTGASIDIRNAVNTDRTRIVQEQQRAVDAAGIQGAKVQTVGNQTVQAVEKLGATTIQALGALNSKLDDQNRQLEALRKQFLDSKNR